VQTPSVNPVQSRNFAAREDGAIKRKPDLG